MRSITYQDPQVMVMQLDWHRALALSAALESRNTTQCKKEGFEVNVCSTEFVLCFAHKRKPPELCDPARGLGRRTGGGEALLSGVTGFLLQVCGVQGPEGGHRRRAGLPLLRQY